MQFVIDIDDQTVAAYSTACGYADMVTDNVGGLVPNPETRGQFALRTLKEHIRKQTKEYEATTTFEVIKEQPLAVPIIGTINLNPIPISVDPQIG